MDDILLEDIISNKAKQEKIVVPGGFTKRIQSTLSGLPERKKYYKLRRIALQAAMFTVIITALIFSTLYITNNGSAVLVRIKNITSGQKLSEKDFRSKKNGEFVFRNVEWGMTPEECFKVEGVPFDEKNLDFSLFNSNNSRRSTPIITKNAQIIFGKSATIAYVFENKRFSEGQYLFEFEEDKIQEGLDFYTGLKKELVNKYGEPLGNNEAPKLENLRDQNALVQAHASWTMSGDKPLKSTMGLSLFKDKSKNGNGKSLFINLSFNGSKFLYEEGIK